MLGLLGNIAQHARDPSPSDLSCSTDERTMSEKLKNS